MAEHQSQGNGYNGGWPSARLFGWSAADWSRPATNKSRKKKKKSIVVLRKEIMNKLVVDLLQQKGLGCWKVLKKRCKQKRIVSSAHKLDGLGKLKEHAPRSEHVHLHQDIGHIRKNHLQATLLPQLLKYAHASGVLTLRITCLDRSRWRYRGTHVLAFYIHVSHFSVLATWEYVKRTISARADRAGFLGLRFMSI